MIVGIIDVKRQFFLRVIKKASNTGHLIYMRYSAPAPPTMAVKELDLQTI